MPVSWEPSPFCKQYPRGSSPEAPLLVPVSWVLQGSSWSHPCRPLGVSSHAGQRGERSPFGTGRRERLDFFFFFGLLSINYAAFEVREEYGPGCRQPALLGGTPGGDEGEIWNLVVVMHAGRGAARTFTLGMAPQQHCDEEDGPDDEEDGPKEENTGPRCAPGLCSSPLLCSSPRIIPWRWQPWHRFHLPWLPLAQGFHNGGIPKLPRSRVMPLRGLLKSDAPI